MRLPAQNLPADSLPMRSLRIAVADDEPDMREYLERVLPRLGHQVVASARTGNELVSACRREHPDLIITDIRMPDLPGDAAVRRIREEEMVPVILISAYARMEAEGNDLALCSRLHKPVGRNELEEAIARLLSQTASSQPPSTGPGDATTHE
jgi:CheY-like chemotaxis protein